MYAFEASRDVARNNATRAHKDSRMDKFDIVGLEPHAARRTKIVGEIQEEIYTSARWGLGYNLSQMNDNCITETLYKLNLLRDTAECGISRSKGHEHR